MYKLLAKLVLMLLCYYVNVAICRSTTSESSLRTISSSSSADITKSGQPMWLTITTSSPDEIETLRESRAMTVDYDDHDDLTDSEEATQSSSSKASLTMQEEAKGVKNDPWYGYYDFLINEGSFKFWAVFQLATAALLIYSSFAAVYYAKFNPLSSDYDYYGDDFFKRRSFTSRRSRSASSSRGSESAFQMDGQTFQRIIDAISPKKFS